MHKGWTKIKGLMIATLIVCVAISGSPVGLADTPSIVAFEKTVSWDSKALYKTLFKLKEAYPNLIEIEKIGESIDHEPIYVVRMTDDISRYHANELYYKANKMHMLVEAGTHAREVINPAIVVKMIEDYCKDYGDNSTLPNYNVKALLQSHVFHFIPLSNPDGYDLAKFGFKSVETPEAQKALLKLKDNKYSKYKSNLRGIDLNRNYNSDYYDASTGKWETYWEKTKNANAPTKPARELFHGVSPASEPESKALSQYLIKYDFRSFLSYHSQGQVVYFNKRSMGKDYDKYAEKLASLVALQSGYKLVKSQTSKPTYGYMGDYAAFQTYKPAITVETTKKISTDKKYYHLKEYQRVSTLPLMMALEAKKKGYFQYRLYQEGHYIRDFEAELIANAFAARQNAVVINGEGMPLYSTLPEEGLLTSDTLKSELGDAFSIGNATKITQSEFVSAFYKYKNKNEEYNNKSEEFTEQAYAWMISNGYLTENQVEPSKYMTLGEWKRINELSRNVSEQAPDAL